MELLHPIHQPGQGLSCIFILCFVSLPGALSELLDPTECQNSPQMVSIKWDCWMGNTVALPGHKL